MIISKTGIKPPRELINWKEIPQSLDYSIAHGYLQILTSPDKASEIVDRLIYDSETQNWNAETILRISGNYPPAMPTESVNEVRRNIASKINLTPPMIVQDVKFRRIHIVSGFSVIVGVYEHNPKASIPCRFVAWDSED